jgi:hypothetical protein
MGLLANGDRFPYERFAVMQTGEGDYIDAQTQAIAVKDGKYY